MLAPLVIDSSVYLSSFFENEPDHIISKQFIREIHESSKDIYLPALVPAEVFNVLMRSKKFKPHFLQEVVKQFVNQPNLKIIPIDEKLLTSLYQTPKNILLKTSDLIITFVALVTHSTLVTWDKTMQKQASKYVTVHTPKYFID